jgi:small-conductance mechanosensitive channel
MSSIRSFLEQALLNVGKYELRVVNILYVLVILIVAWSLLWLFKKYLKRKKRVGRLDEGKLYSLSQIATYIVTVIAIMAAIDAIGFNITVLLAGSTALLVGLGLGLQDLFRDMVAGFIILFERAITAGDIVEIDEVIGKVKEVGLRTTSIITREDIVMIVPNSKLTTDYFINWSQNHHTSRFKVEVGVAYGSNTALVQDILLKSLEGVPHILANPAPFVDFQDFGNSSLDFGLYFFSSNLFRIERTKSIIRFNIDALFRENGVTIPFPQRDLWIKQTPPQQKD